MTETSTGMNLPNKITMARLVIAILLFVMLSLHIQFGETADALTLNLAAVIFIVCVATDWLDGYLARRWGLVTDFGRIADPFVDKVVVCGSFIYLVILVPDLVRPWAAVTITAREFLVTTLRGFVESRGVEFGAQWAGKLKMVIQSMTIPAILFYQANFLAEDHPWHTGWYWFSWGLMFLTIATTLLSALDYIRAGARALRVTSSSEEPV